MRGGIFGLILLLLAGAAYTARAFTLTRTPGELAASYPLLLGAAFCASILVTLVSLWRGVGLTGQRPESIPKRDSKGPTALWQGLGRSPKSTGKFWPKLTASLTCFVLFTLAFERAGAVLSSFVFAFALSAVWRGAAGVTGNALSVLTASLCACGVWAFDRLFALMLP